jgi:hypothetical protein
LLLLIPLRGFWSVFYGCCSRSRDGSSGSQETNFRSKLNSLSTSLTSFSKLQLFYSSRGCCKCQTLVNNMFSLFQIYFWSN